LFQREQTPKNRLPVSGSAHVMPADVGIQRFIHHQKSKPLGTGLRRGDGKGQGTGHRLRIQDFRGKL